MGQFLMFAKVFAAVRPGRRNRPPLVCSAPALRMPRTKKSRPFRDRVVDSGPRSQISPSEFLTNFSGTFAS